MSEICLDCWNKNRKVPEKRRDFVMTHRPDLCEECGQWKSVIIRYRLHRIWTMNFTDFLEGIQYQLKQKEK
jgi:hypothetical protein